MALEIAWGGNHAHTRLGELARSQRAIFQITNADGHIKALRNQFHIAIVEDHIHGDIWEIREKLAQHRRKVVHTKICRHRNSQ